MADKKLNFTKAYEELEAIVRDFESRELDLEKDIAQFEKGMKLAKQLKERLRDIENKVEEISSQFDESNSAVMSDQ